MSISVPSERPMMAGVLIPDSGTSGGVVGAAGVAVALSVAVALGVAVGVAVDLGVAVGVALPVGVGLPAVVGDGLGLGEAVGVGLGVGVVAGPISMRTLSQSLSSTSTSAIKKSWGEVLKSFPAVGHSPAAAPGGVPQYRYAILPLGPSRV